MHFKRLKIRLDYPPTPITTKASKQTNKIPRVVWSSSGLPQFSRNYRKLNFDISQFY